LDLLSNNIGDIVMAEIPFRQNLDNWKAPYDTDYGSLFKDAPISSTVSLGTYPVARKAAGWLGNIASWMATKDTRTPAQRIQDNIGVAREGGPDQSGGSAPMRNIVDAFQPREGTAKLIPLPKEKPLPKPAEKPFEGWTESYPIGLVSTPYEEDKSAAPVQTATKPTIAMSAMPAPAFDPRALELAKGTYRDALGNANAKQDESNNLMRQWMDAEARNMPSGYGDSALATIAAGNRFKQALGGLSGGLEKQGANELSAMGHALPALNTAFQLGNELPEAVTKASMLSKLKNQEAKEDPMFPTEKALKESMTGFHNAQTKALPLQTLIPAMKTERTLEPHVKLAQDYMYLRAQAIIQDALMRGN
jgi:hypothetical protein